MGRDGHFHAMMRAMRKLMVLAALAGTWVLWTVVGHEGRTMSRLVDEGVVTPESHCRLLHSTGYGRENKHVYECAPEELLSPEEGGVVWHRVDWENENHARHFEDRIRPLVDGCTAPPVAWQEAVVYNADGKGLLAELFLVKQGGRCLVVLAVF